MAYEADEPRARSEPLRQFLRGIRWHVSRLAGPRVLSLAPHKRLSKHFHEREFACNHCGKLASIGVPAELVDILEQVREHFRRPVHVTSGYRCPVHNRNVGGARHSQHLRGTAADIVVNGVPASRVHAFLRSIRGDQGGLGQYRRFTHVDIGPDGRRW